MLKYPGEPVRTALIGAGNRSRKIYQPLFKSLSAWLDIVAVCDPEAEHADALAASLGARAYYSVLDMIKDRGIEAAIVVVPIPLHYAYSVLLSENGIHNLIETTWCSTLSQARAMVRKAEENGVVTSVAENFHYYPIDRFAQTLRDSGYIGEIKRIFSYNDHTGFHSNSRWLTFAKEYPEWVSSVEHTMQVEPYYESPERFWEFERFRSRMIGFPNGLMVIDQAANIKGMLGRQVRPGFNEWHGSLGTLVQQGARYQAPHYRYYDNNHRVEAGNGVHSDWTAEIRRCMYDNHLEWSTDIRPAHPNVMSKVERYYTATGAYAGVHAAIPGGVIDYSNPLILEDSGDHYFPEYGVCVASHLVDFALAVRGFKQMEFGPQDALMSMMMEVAARESVLNNGARVALPLSSDLASDDLVLAELRKKMGIDPMDVEATVMFRHAKP